MHISHLVPRMFFMKNEERADTLLNLWNKAKLSIISDFSSKVNSPLKVSTVLLGAVTDSRGDDRPIRGCYVTYTSMSMNNFGYPENYDFEQRHVCIL